jgi:hypothetical protein
METKENICNNCKREVILCKGLCSKCYHCKWHLDYYSKNKNTILEKQKIWKKDNNQFIRHSNKRYVENNRAKIKESQKDYYKQNKEEINKKQKEWHKNNLQEIKQKAKDYYLINKEHILIKSKESYKKNKSKRLKQTLLWRANHSEDYKKSQRENRKRRTKIDNEFNLLERLRGSSKIRLKNNIFPEKITHCSKYGIDYKKIIEYLKPFPPDMENWEIHHIRPLVTFNFINNGLIDYDEIKKAFAPENHQWMKKEEHRKLNHMELICQKNL